MFFTINELSIEKTNTKEEAISLLEEFSDVSSFLFRIGFKEIKVWDISSFKSFEISDRFHVIDWLKQVKFKSDKERQKCQRLKSLIGKTSLLNWNDQEKEQIENCPLIGLIYKGNESISQGLKIAYLHNSIAVSFSKDPFWNCTSLELILLEEIDGETLEQTANVNHASNVINVIGQSKWFNSLIDKRAIFLKWNPLIEMFPCLHLSNLLVENGDWNAFQMEKENAKSKDEIRAIIIKYSDAVAERNFYRKDERMSEFNSTSQHKRIVYNAGIGKERIYLSVDLEKGGFEVCDFRGRHLGEYFFDGQKKSDSKAGHNLKIKS